MSRGINKMGLGEDAGTTPWGRVVALSHRLALGKPSHLVAAALLAIAGVALVLRLASLTNVPTNVTADEADNLQVVYHILEGHGPSFFGLDWKPAPAFSTYLIAGFMRLFGMDIAGMRMSSVLLGSLTTVALYFLARQHISRLASLASAFLLATALWHLHFSRSGWENVHIGLFAVLEGVL